MRIPKSFGAHLALLNNAGSSNLGQRCNRFAPYYQRDTNEKSIVLMSEKRSTLTEFWMVTSNEHDDELLGAYINKKSSSNNKEDGLKRKRKKYQSEWCCLLPRGGSTTPEPYNDNVANTVLEAAVKKALSGGLTGSIAGVLQVFMFMWLRTVMNYQYRHGGEGYTVLKKLWNEGGIRRLYRGLPFAIIQGPMARFGSAASNTLVMTLHSSNAHGFGNLPIFFVTMMGSILTALYRAALMPIDTLKIVSQVEGRQGFQAVLKAAFLHGRIHILYTGAYAMAAATLIGHFPWFVTFNLLDKSFPKPMYDDHAARALRSAFIGFSSSLVSDLVSNPIRVIKTTKQSTAAAAALSSIQLPKISQKTAYYKHNLKNERNAISPTTSKQDETQSLPSNSSYAAIISHIIRTDGISAFLTRGLSTRILVNGLQSMVFTVVWRFLLGE